MGSDPIYDARMKIQKLETLRLAEFPNLIWLRVHSDAGIAGLGETHRAAPAVEEYVHEYIAPRVLGQDPMEVERLSRSLIGYLGFRGSGVETRGQTSANWGLDAKPGGPYEDLEAFLHRADELAHSLLEQGIGAMKIWPFDTYAERNEGMHISGSDLHAALEPFRRIRKAVGSKMDVMVEFHSLWRLPPAQRIAQALAEFDTYWHEDPIRMDSLALLKAYAPHSKAPICASEILAGRWSFKDLLETGVAGIVMFDLAWCGGISEGRRIAALADAWQLPVAPHDCTGPIVFLASLHFSIHAPNALVQESVRAFYTGWYKELVTHVPQPERGMFAKPPGPGLGAELLPGLWKRKDAAVRASSL